MFSVRVKKKLGSILIDADFAIERPTITVLLGKSGAGKTTIANIIAGLVAPDEGRIEFNGTVFYDSLSRLSLPPEKRGIGYVFQEHRLFPNMLVERNLTFGRFPGGRKNRESLEKVIDMLEIGTLLDRRPSTLSGGESQRVAIGRALISCTTLLIMDEPLSSLDPSLKDGIMKYIAMIPENFDFPMLYITHSDSEVKKLAGTVMTVLDGRLSYCVTASLI